MNQIYACPKGTLSPSGTVNTRTATTNSSVRIISKLLMGVFLFLVLGAVSFAQTATFPTSGVFIVPPGVTSINIDATGAGGGGAGGLLGVPGGGGGGAGFQRSLNVAVTPGQIITVTVGTGGTGGVLFGADGGPTSVGVGGINIPGAGGGSIPTGGLGSIPVGANTINNTGGAGGDGGILIVIPFGGGGGGAASAAGVGVAGNSGAAAGTGGTIGGGSGTPGSGTNATAPGGGGGGGGGAPLSIGGNGGNGFVIITFACPTYSITPVAPLCGAFSTPDVPLVGFPAFSAGPPAGPLFSGPGVQGPNGAQVFDASVAGPGCHTITYSYAGPAFGCTVTTSIQIVVFPVTPTLPAITNTCDAPLTIGAIPAVAGFTAQYAVDPPGAAPLSAFGTLAAAQALMTTAPGCWEVQARYILTAACGATGAGATGSGDCAPGSTSAVVFPPTAVGPPIANTCNSLIVITPIAAIPGFTATYAVDPPGAAPLSAFGPLGAAIALTTTPGCYEIQSRYELAAACGGTAAGATGTGACAPSSRFAVRFPPAPVITAPPAVCFPGAFALPTVPAIPGFTVEYSIALAGFTAAPIIPAGPGQFLIQARYVTAAACGGTPAGTPGTGACGASNAVFGTIIGTPQVNDPADITQCCNTTVTVNFSSPANIPPGGVFTYNWTNTNTLIGLPAAGAGNISFLATCNPLQEVATVTVTPSYTFLGVTCVGTPQVFTITIRPGVDGVIQVPNNHTICAGQNGNQNIDVSGVAPFAGVWNITNLTTLASAPFNFTVLVPGPSNVLIPAVRLPNTTSTPITYRIDWISLTDANGCPGAPFLTGSANITVMPLPVIQVTGVTLAPGSICPGTALVFNVINAPPNTVPFTFNWVATAFGGAVLGSGTNVLPGDVTTITINCAVPALTNPITFTFTPYGVDEPYCPGPTVTQTVIVQDIVPPVFTGPNANGNTTVQCNDAAAIALARAFVPTASNTNCVGVTVTPTLLGEVFTPSCNNNGIAGYQAGETGTLVTTWTATEPCGLSATITQTITIVDTQAPTWVTTAGTLNTTVQCGNAAALAAAQALAPTATDNCAFTLTPVKTAGAPAPGTCPVSSVIINTWTVQDACGNTVAAPFSQVITIVDTQGPVMFGGNAALPGPQTLNVGAGANCTVPLPNYITLLNFAGNTTDCVGGVTFTQSPAIGTPVTGLGGFITITITATDACTNSSTRTFVVSLVDNTAPIAVCVASPGFGVITTPPTLPATIYVTLNASGNSTLTPTDFNNGSSDACGNTLTYSLLEVGPGNGFNGPGSQPTFGCDDVGPQTIMLVVTDASGNTAGCTVNVIVRDLTAPVINNCPAGSTQTVVRDAGCIGTIPNYITQFGITATDACGLAAPPLNITQFPIPGTFYGAGPNQTITGTITATDVNGNSTTCTFTIRIVDQTPPVVTCPTQVTALNPVATVVNAVGTNFTVTTGAGNTDCRVVVNYAPPTVTDNCAVFPNPTTITPVLISGANTASGQQFFVGTTTVTYRATDAAGNSATCSFTITVIDNTAPTITCPSNKSVSPNAAGCVYTHPNTSWDAVAFDNCLLVLPPDIRYTATGATVFGPVTTLNGVTFNQGLTTVTAQAFDNAIPGPNASIPCTFTVTVADNTVPVITCPANVVVTTGLSGSPCSVVVPASQLAPVSILPNPDFCPVFVEWTVSGATPNSSGLGNMPAFTFNQGVTTVEYRVSDAAGNSSTCFFTVTVNNTVTGTITGNATVQFNTMTTSTVTFTGAGGVAPYTFTYNVNGGPTQTITTIVGNSVTVAQQNNVLGTFVYTLLSVSAAGGCPGTVPLPPNNTATIIVGPAGVPDLIILPTQSSSQILPGGTIQEVFTVRNIGTGPTTAPVTFTINRFPPGSGLTATLNGAASVTIGFDNFTLHNNTEAGWTVVTTASQYIFTYTGVIGTGIAGSKNVGITVTRAAAPNQGANGQVNQTATVAAGTGGGESPTFNNGATVTIVKN